MAWRGDKKIGAARDFGEKHNAKQVVILYITEDHQLGYASWGKTRLLCGETKTLADAAYEAMADRVARMNEEEEY